MKETVGADGFQSDVAKYIKGQFVFVVDFFREFQIVRGDGDDGSAGGFEGFLYVSETSEFYDAERSPMPAIEDEQHRPLAFVRRQLNPLAVLVWNGEVVGVLADGDNFVGRGKSHQHVHGQ